MQIKWPAFIATTAADVRIVDNGEEKIVHSGNGVYYGISWDREFIYVLGRDGRRKPGTPDIFILDHNYDEVGVCPGDYVDGHQVLCEGTTLYTVVTSTNGVEALDLQTQRLNTHNWTGHTHDVNHVNSIFKDGEHFWVVYHNLGKKTGNPGQVVKLNSDMSTILHEYDIGKEPHNVARVGEELFLCSSGARKLIVYDLVSECVTREVYLNDWVRGLGITDDFVVVGTAMVAANRKDRLVGDCDIYLLDRSTLNILDKVVLKGSGTLHDLRLVGVTDYAHNGIDFPGRIDTK